MYMIWFLNRIQSNDDVFQQIPPNRILPEVTMASVKNFQLVGNDDPDMVFLQFGRAGKEVLRRQGKFMAKAWIRWGRPRNLWQKGYYLYITVDRVTYMCRFSRCRASLRCVSSRTAPHTNPLAEVFTMDVRFPMSVVQAFGMLQFSFYT